MTSEVPFNLNSYLPVWAKCHPQQCEDEPCGDKAQERQPWARKMGCKENCWSTLMKDPEVHFKRMTRCSDVDGTPCSASLHFFHTEEDSSQEFALPFLIIFLPWARKTQAPEQSRDISSLYKISEELTH